MAKWVVEDKEFTSLEDALTAAGMLAEVRSKHAKTSRDLKNATVSVYREDGTVAARVSAR